MNGIPSDRVHGVLRAVNHGGHHDRPEGHTVSDLDRALELTRKAIDDFDDPTVPTSATLRRALRIASLRNDALDLYWLELEATDLGSKEPGWRRESAVVHAAELRGIDPDEWDAYREAQYSQYCARRRRRR